MVHFSHLSLYPMSVCTLTCSCGFACKICMNLSAVQNSGLPRECVPAESEMDQICFREGRGRPDFVKKVTALEPPMRPALETSAALKSWAK
jgi:hypothetical protein